MLSPRMGDGALAGTGHVLPKPREVFSRYCRSIEEAQIAALTLLDGVWRIVNRYLHDSPGCLQGIPNPFDERGRVTKFERQ